MPEQSRKVRYAVVGLGWIAQECVLPAFANTPNCELAALVTGDPEKAREIGSRYGVRRTASYDDYEKLVRSGDIDAVFIALPNHLHKDFTIAAVRAGVHALCEKPMAANAAECEEMIRAAEQGGAKIMIGYRLHFEPANLKAISLVASGRIGEPRVFTSVFCQQVQQGNIRVRKDAAGGPLPDMGVYQINAARYLFREEPVEVGATGLDRGDPRFDGVHEAVSAIMRFPGERVANFTCSFGAASSDSSYLVGAEGWLRLSPGFDFGQQKRLALSIGGSFEEEAFPRCNEFGGELAYFADCILNNTDPEPDGREGLADVRIVDAMLESIRTQKPVALAPFEKKTRPDESMKRELPPVPFAKLFRAAKPGGGS